MDVKQFLQKFLIMEHEVPSDPFRSYYWPHANLPHPSPDPSNAHLP